MAHSLLSLAIGFRRATPEQHVRRRQQALADAVAGEVSRGRSQTYRVTDCRATRTGTLLIRLHGDDLLIGKLSLRTTNEPRLRHSADTLAALHACDWLTPFLADRCPRVVAAGTASGHYYSVETAIPGQDGLQLLKTKVGVQELILSAEQFALRLQKASLPDDGSDPRAWAADFEAAVERVARLADAAGGGARYAELIADLSSGLDRQPVPSTYSHGNFWPGNVLFGADTSVTGVIDWDCATTRSLPAVDLIYFLIRSYSLMRGGGFGEAFADWIDERSLPLLDGCLVRHCQELMIPLDLIVPLAYCSWIQHLDAHCRFGTATSSQARWLRRNVGVVLDRWRPSTRQSGPGLGRWSETAWR